jgi:hypothetical protein
VLEVSEVRKRIRAAIAQARLAASERRTRTDVARLHYERFLAEVAGPVVRQFAGVMRAEGFAFHVATPADALRLESDRTRDDYLEIYLDPSDPPTVTGRVSFERGRRVTSTERPLREGAAIVDLDEEDVLAFLLAEIGPFVEK